LRLPVAMRAVCHRERRQLPPCWCGPPRGGQYLL